MSLFDDLREFAESEGERLIIPVTHDIPRILGALVHYLDNGGSLPSSGDPTKNDDQNDQEG